MVRSIRVRLLLWYTAVLTAVVGGFAVLLYYEVRAARLAEVDGQLDTAAAGLESSLRLFPRFELTGEDPPDRPEFPPPKGQGKQPKGPKGEFGPPPKGEFGRPMREKLLASLNLPGRPDADDPNAPYFGVWRANETLVKSAGLPAETQPPTVVTRRAHRFQGSNREVIARGPERTTILVGRPAGHLADELAAFAWQLAGTGAAVLAVGLAGGWFLSGRIVRPIARIADTASRISGANLSERIDDTRVETELADLARVLNAAFDRLQAAFDRQARFTADASHELRTPLAVLRAQAELALSRPRSADELRKTIEANLAAVERMTALVERLLALARADAGDAGLRREPVALDRVAADAVALLAPLAEKSGVSVSIEAEPVMVTGDAAALGQVAGNLVSNAIRYNKPGGTVRVSVSSKGQSAILAVEDTGVGIPEEEQSHLFERFYRADSSRARTTGGHGLGLAICEAIASAHGGTIAFESAPGTGSTFRVVLPRA